MVGFVVSDAVFSICFEIHIIFHLLDRPTVRSSVIVIADEVKAYQLSIVDIQLGWLQFASPVITVLVPRLTIRGRSPCVATLYRLARTLWFSNCDVMASALDAPLTSICYAVVSDNVSLDHYALLMRIA